MLQIGKFQESFIREALGEFKTAFKTANKGDPARGELAHNKQAQIIGKLEDTFKRHGGQVRLESYGEAAVKTSDRLELEKIGKIAKAILSTRSVQTGRLGDVKPMLETLAKQTQEMLNWQ